MSRRFYNDGEELIFEDLNAETALLEKELYERTIFEMLQRTENAFFANSFMVEFLASAQVNVLLGTGFQTDNTQVDPESVKRLIFSALDQTIPLSAPDTVHDRIDIVVVKSIRETALTQTRNYKDPITSIVTPTSFVVETDWSSDVQVVAGTPAVSPSVPSTPSGYIKLAEVLVHAVTGVGSQADITDKRNLMPIGGAISVDSSTFSRAPASTTEALQLVLKSFDNYLTAGLQTWTDMVDQGSDPAVPASGRFRFYSKGGVLFLRDSGGAVSPVGSGGGGGGGANWNPNDGAAPVQDSEEGEKVWLFTKADAGAQKLSLFVKVPQGYIAGRQILMYLGQYSPSTSNTQLLVSTTSLVRVNLDAAGSTANQRVSTNAALTNTVANQYRQPSLDLTDSTGKINGFSVSPGDLLRVDLVRGSDTDTADIRFIPSATEVKFS